MRQRLLCVLVWSALVLAAVATVHASDGGIRLLFDPEQCQGFVPCGESRTLYVYAVLDGATENGITGVEFSLRFGADGAADPGWTFVEDFAPNTVALGAGGFNPPDQHAVTPPRNRGRGVNVAWSECQTGDDDLVLIETVTITNTGCSTQELRLLVQSHDTPRNSFFRCPLASLCDGPLYTKVCLGNDVSPCTNPDGPNGDPAWCSTSGEAVINPASDSQSPCRVTAIAPATWGKVKDLYR